MAHGSIKPKKNISALRMAKKKALPPLSSKLHRLMDGKNNINIWLEKKRCIWLLQKRNCMVTNVPTNIQRIRSMADKIRLQNDGTVRNSYFSGVRIGQMWRTSIWHSILGLMPASTTAAMLSEVWTNSLPSMKGITLESWKLWAWYLIVVKSTVRLRQITHFSGNWKYR